MTEKLSGEPYNRISCEEAYKFYGDEDSHFIDVRNDDEYASGHIPGSIHIPVEQFLQSMDKLPENGNLYFICAAGARSGLACEFSASFSIEEVAEISNCPVIISGGVSSINDIKKAKNLNNIEGVIVGKAIYDGDIKLDELAKEINA